MVLICDTAFNNVHLVLENLLLESLMSNKLMSTGRIIWFPSSVIQQSLKIKTT